MKKHFVFGFVCLALNSIIFSSILLPQKNTVANITPTTQKSEASAIPTDGPCMWRMFDKTPHFFVHEGCRLG